MMLSRRWTFRSRRGKSRSNSVSPSADLVLEPRTMSGEAAEEDRSAAAAAEEEEDAGARAGVDRWSRMLPELMGEILGRVEASEDRWPARGSVVSCACVCRRWRRITTGIVRSPAETGMITFPASLKQPGPKDSSIQCFIKRNKKTSTFYLYLGLTQSLAENGKFLMAARRFRHGTHTEYIISLDADNLSQGSNAYLGKLRSDFLGTKFLIYDSLSLYDGAKATSTRGIQCFASKRISPQVAASNFEIGQVSYKSNILRSRGPRRILCKIQCPSAEPTDGQPQVKSVKQDNIVGTRTIALKNKSPRWHQHLQCWCLNFHGRVTVASVKNFQLVETVDIDQPGGSREQETVLLQFGRVGDDLFTMDYRHPLSAFQAFAISLSSYGSKFACE